jgi:tetratricopeptide (TPR) repeat protein
MYELGFAHALEKPAIILNQQVHESPFDVADFRQIEYNRNFLVKDCRPRLISAISDVFGESSAEAVEAIESPLEKERSEDPGTTPGPPLRVGSSLVAALQKIHLQVQQEGVRRQPELLAQAAREVRNLLDRVTIVDSGDPQDRSNTAGVTGNCAVEFEKLEMFEAAEDIYKRALSLFPDYAGLHIQYADFLIDQNRAAEARSELDRAKQLNPTDSRILRVEMKLGFRGGQLSSTIGETLKAQFDASPGSKVTASAYLLYLDRTSGPLAEFEAVCAKWQEALPEGEKWIARRALADHLASREGGAFRERALQIYEELLATKEVEDQAEMLHNMATLYASLDKRDLARERWTLAYRLDPANAAIQASFSQWLSSQGEKQLAFRVISGEQLDG